MKSRATTQFWACFENLPAQVQRQARAAYKLWARDPRHPSLHFKELERDPPFWSVRIGKRWRALATQDGGAVIWFWIGSHAEYDRLIRPR